MKILVITLLFVISLIAADLKWSNDYNKAVEIAKKENKDIYILITSSDCRWCRKFENTTLKDKDMLAYLKSKFVLVHIDRDFDDMPEYFEAKRVPTHYFTTSKKDIIHTFPGYWNSEDFNSFLKDVDDNKLKYQTKNKEISK